MPLIEALQTGVLYRNPIPHGRSVHAYSPCLLVLFWCYVDCVANIRWFKLSVR